MRTFLCAVIGLLVGGFSGHGLIVLGISILHGPLRLGAIEVERQQASRTGMGLLWICAVLLGGACGLLAGVLVSRLGPARPEREPGQPPQADEGAQHSQSGPDADWKGSGWGGLLGLIPGVVLALGVAVLSYYVMPSAWSSEGIAAVFDFFARLVLGGLCGAFLGMLVGGYLWIFARATNLKSPALTLVTATLLGCLLCVFLLYVTIPQPTEALDLAGQPITDAELKALKGLKDPETLSLRNTQVTDAGLRQLKDLPTLRGLDLSGTAITDVGLQELRDLKNLQTLNLSGTAITDAGLKELPGLSRLSLQNTRITDAGLRALKAVFIDRLILQWLRVHPGGQVVALGEGLETQFHRVDEGSVRWLSVDLPEAIAVRQRYLPDSERHRNFAGSALDFRWMDLVTPDSPLFVTAAGLLMYLRPEEVHTLLTAIADRFPDAEMAFDVIPRWFSRLTVRGVKRTPHYTLPPMPWGLNRHELQGLKQWHPNIGAVEEIPFEGGRGFFWNGFVRVLRRLPWLGNRWFTLVHLRCRASRPAP